MPPLSQLLGAISAILSVGIPLAKAATDLLKNARDKQKQALEDRIAALESDSTLTREYVKCKDENERLKAALATLGYNLVDS